MSTYSSTLSKLTQLDRTLETTNLDRKMTTTTHPEETPHTSSTGDCERLTTSFLSAVFRKAQNSAYWTDTRLLAEFTFADELSKDAAAAHGPRTAQDAITHIFHCILHNANHQVP
jgi:hypothetical protein